MHLMGWNYSQAFSKYESLIQVIGSKAHPLDTAVSRAATIAAL